MLRTLLTQETYETALGTLKQISNVVDSLYQKASELT